MKADHEKIADSLAMTYAQVGNLCDAMNGISPLSRAVSRLVALKRALGQLRRELAGLAFKSSPLNQASPYGDLEARLEKLIGPETESNGSGDAHALVEVNSAFGRLGVEVSSPLGFKTGLLAIGVLPEKEREDGSQHRVPVMECKWLSLAMKLTEAINNAREQAPIDQWPDSHVETLREALRPLVELYESL